MPLRTSCGGCCGSNSTSSMGFDNVISSNSFPLGGIASNEIINRVDLNNTLFTFDATTNKYLSIARYTEPFGRDGVVSSNTTFQRTNSAPMVLSGIPLRDDIDLCITDLTMNFDTPVDMTYQLNRNGFQTIYTNNVASSDRISESDLNIFISGSDTKFIAVRTGLVATGTLENPRGTLVYALAGIV